MPIGWRPTHPGDPTPAWGPLGRMGCLVFATAVLVILLIAAMIGGSQAGPPEGHVTAVETAAATSGPNF